MAQKNQRLNELETKVQKMEERLDKLEAKTAPILPVESSLSSPPEPKLCSDKLTVVPEKVKSNILLETEARTENISLVLGKSNLRTPFVSEIPDREEKPLKLLKEVPEPAQSENLSTPEITNQPKLNKFKDLFQGEISKTEQILKPEFLELAEDPTKSLAFLLIMDY